MKIIKATNYGFRTVVKVLLNPDAPEAIHADGSPHTGKPTTAVTAAFFGEFDRPPRSWEWCHKCTYNWQITEIQWDGDEQYNITEDGSKTLKTSDQLIAEIQLRLQPPSEAQAITELAERTI